MIVPSKYSKSAKVGDIVVMTHRGGLIETLSKEILKKQHTKIHCSTQS